MRIISNLLARHAMHLSASQHAAVAEHIRRFEAREAFSRPEDMSDLDAQTAFILFEREASATPVSLFGQDVASLAHTRVRVYRARRGADGIYEPDKEIFAARMSEKSLTEAILLSNRGEGSPLTATRLGDFQVPAHEGAYSRADRAAEVLRTRHQGELTAAISEIKAQLQAEPARSNAALKESVMMIRYKIRDMVSSRYALERHLEAMTTTRSEVLTEAAHAALHASKIKAALAADVKALPAAEKTDWTDAAAHHPMVDSILDSLSQDMKEALRILIVAEIRGLGEDRPGLLRWIQEDGDQAMIAFPQARDRSQAIGWGEDTKEIAKHIDTLATIWNWAFNQSLAASRDLRRATQASLYVSQRQGWLGNIHSTLPPSEGTYFSLSFSAAWEHDDMGTPRVRSAMERLLEVEIIAEDLMTALRGHPDGLPVPCSLRSLCGIWLQPVERPRHQVDADIATISDDIENSDNVKQLQAAFSRLEELVGAKRSGKSWRKDVEAAVADLEVAARHAGISVEESLSKGRQKIDEHVVRSAEGVLGSIARSLPREAIDLLRITRDTK